MLKLWVLALQYQAAEQSILYVWTGVTCMRSPLRSVILSASAGSNFLCSGRLTIQEQQKIWSGVRTPGKVNWPDWGKSKGELLCSPDLRSVELMRWDVNAVVQQMSQSRSLPSGNDLVCFAPQFSSLPRSMTDSASRPLGRRIYRHSDGDDLVRGGLSGSCSKEEKRPLRLVAQ